MPSSIGFYAGSFDPFTTGHMALLCDTLIDYDKVVVGIAINQKKQDKYLFPTPQKRAELVKLSIQDAINEYKNRENHNRIYTPNEAKALQRIISHPDCLEIAICKGITVDAAIAHNATALIRGKRARQDDELENKLQHINQRLLEIRDYDIKTDIRILQDERFKHVSSGDCKDLFAYGEYILAKEYVSPSVHTEMMKIYLQKEYTRLARHYGVAEDGIEQDYQSFIKTCSHLSHLGCCFNRIAIHHKTREHLDNYNDFCWSLFYTQSTQSADRILEVIQNSQTKTIVA